MTKDSDDNHQISLDVLTKKRAGVGDRERDMRSYVLFDHYQRNAKQTCTRPTFHRCIDS
jgi:hypothetical protein